MKKLNWLWISVLSLGLSLLSCSKNDTLENIDFDEEGINLQIFESEHEFSEGEIVDFMGLPEVRELKGEIRISPSDKNGCINLLFDYSDEDNYSDILQFVDLPVRIRFLKSTSGQEVISSLEIDDYLNSLFFSLIILENGNAEYTISIIKECRQYNCKGIINDVINNPALGDYLKTPESASDIKLIDSKLENFNSPLKSTNLSTKEFNNLKQLFLCAKNETPLTRTQLKLVNKEKYSTPLKSTSGIGTTINIALFHEVFLVDDPGPNQAAEILSQTAADVIDFVVFKDANNYDLSRSTILSDIRFFNTDFINNQINMNLKAYQTTTYGDMSTAFMTEDYEWITDHDIQALWGYEGTERVYPTGTIVLMEQGYGAYLNDMANAWINYGASCFIGNPTATPENTQSFITSFWIALSVYRYSVSEALTYAKAVSGDPGVQQFKIIGDSSKRWP